MVAAPLEKQIEGYLLSSCREQGLLCLKFTSPSRAGVPDRLVVAPHRTVFVEVKRPGEKPRKLQRVRHDQIRRHGGEVHVVDSRPAVDELVNHLTAGGSHRRSARRGSCGRGPS